MSRCLRCAVFCVALLCSGAAYGQTAPTSESGSARSHFNEGLARVARGELDAGLHEFETAYALNPHYSVLYNIGQAQAALGHPVEAIKAFERYLLEGGKRLSQARRDEVRELIAANRARLGKLRLLGASDHTRVWLDGVEIEKAALSEPLLLTSGPHRLLSSDGAGFPASQEVQVVAGGSAELTLPSEPASVAESAKPPAPAQLRVVCDLPGVTVEVGGTTRATTPLPGPLTVPAGALEVRFERSGYRPVIQHVLASPKAPAVALCAQVLEPELAPAVKSTLVVHAVPFDAEIFVDGERFLGAALPYGPHEMRVERAGFVGQRKAISLRPRDVTTYQITLSPTAARQADKHLAESRRKFIGYATGAGGLAAASTSAALWGWNSGRYDAWSHDRTASTGNQLQTVTSIQRVDDVAVGCLALGAALVATSAWLLLSEPPENQ